LRRLRWPRFVSRAIRAPLAVPQQPAAAAAIPTSSTAATTLSLVIGHPQHA